MLLVAGIAAAGLDLARLAIGGFAPGGHARRTRHARPWPRLRVLTTERARKGRRLGLCQAFRRWPLCERGGVGDLGAVVGAQVVQCVVLGLLVTPGGEGLVDGGGVGDGDNGDAAGEGVVAGMPAAAVGVLPGHHQPVDAVYPAGGVKVGLGERGVGAFGHDEIAALGGEFIDDGRLGVPAMACSPNTASSKSPGWWASLP